MAGQGRGGVGEVCISRVSLAWNAGHLRGRGRLISSQAFLRGVARGLVAPSLFPQIPLLSLLRCLLLHVPPPTDDSLEAASGTFSFL